MKTGKKLFSVLILTAGVLLASVNVCNAKDIQLIDKDKAQIVKSILLDIDFLSRGLRIGETKDVVYLSTENISPELMPEIRGVHFILVNPEEVEEKSKNGFGYYAFTDFKVRGSKVLVSFGDTWRNDRGGAVSYRTTHYEFRKMSGRWRRKEVSVSIGRS